MRNGGDNPLIQNRTHLFLYVTLRAREDDDYVCKAASNVKEAAETIEAGFEYVCDFEETKLFRKRK
jgi:hypothetical protein